MFARIGKFLAPPVFEDEEKTRVAALLNTILLAFFVIASVFTVVAGLSVSTATVTSLFIGFGTGILGLALWFVMRRGYVRLTSLLFSVMVMVGITLALYSSGNVQSSMSAGYIICIVAAGILMGNWAAPTFTVASLLALVGLFQADAAGLLPPGRESNSLVGYVAVFCITAVLIGLANRSIAASLIRTRRSEHDLAERNRELAERTQDLTERARELRLTADLSQRLATMRDLDLLLAQSVELIRESFDLYYVQVYLADSAGRNLALRAGTGGAGAALVRRGHALPIGSGSINGVAASTKKAAVVPDTAQSATFLPNPLLPDTRSEMAVPLVVGEQVVGVLNLQDDQPGFLTDAALPVFETLAGQLAIAVDNANLFAEATQARAEVEAQLQRLARTGWQDFMDGIQHSERIGYAYEGDTLAPIVEPLATTPTPHILFAPIQVQQAPVGAIQIEGEDGQAWTEAETELVTSVANQVARQVENLRLLAQADQYRAEAEQVTRRLTREGWQEYLMAKAESSAGFVYDRYEVKPLTSEVSPAVEVNEPVLTRPLQVHGEPVGQLTLREIATLNDEVVELTTAVAERLSTHIESLRLFEETRTREHELEERGRELEASQRVTFAAAETTDPSELLDLVVNLIRDQFNLYHVQVYLVDEEKQAAVLHESTGYAGRQLLEQGHQIPLDQTSLVTIAIRESEPVVRNDVSKDEDWLPNPLLPYTSSELVLPLKAGGRMIGALDVQSRSRDFFSPTIVALFQTMAEQVAMNFQTSDLLERTTEQAESLTRFTTQLRTAAEVARRMGAILDPEQLLEQTAELLQSRFGLYHAHIYIVDEVNRRLVMRAGSGEVGRVLRKEGHAIPLDAERSLVARAARDAQMVLVEDTSLEADFMPNPLLPQTRAEIAIPLISGEKVLGVLDIQDDESNRFSETDLDTFSTLAGQIATTLQTAGTYEQTQLRLQVSQALATVQTEDEVLDVLIQQMGIYPNTRPTILTIMPEAEEMTTVLRRQANYECALDLLPEGLQFPVSQFPGFDSSMVTATFLSSNLLEDESAGPALNEMARQTGVRSMFTLPLMTGGQILGIISVSSPEVGYFDEEKLQLYRTLAEQGATALRIARLNDSIQRSLRETRVRLEVSQALAGAQTEDDVLDILIQKAGLYPKAQAMLFVNELEGEAAYVVARRIESFDSKMQSSFEPGTRLPLAQFDAVTGHESATGEFVSLNLLADERVDAATREMAKRMGTVSMAVIPIGIGDEKLGSFAFNSKEKDYFDEQKLSLYRTLAAQGATALRIARLNDATERERDFSNTVINSLPTTFFMFDTQGNLVRWNDKFLAVSELSPEEVVGAQLPDFVVEEDLPVVMETVQKVFAEGQAEVEARSIAKASGREIPYHFTAARAIVDNQPYLLGAGLDITERKKAEAAILQERNFSTAVINSLPGIFYVIDDQANLTQWNKQYETITGYTAEELPAVGALGSIAKEDQTRVAERIQQAFVEGEATVEAHLATKSGERLPYYLTGLRAQIEDKTYLVGMGIDITDRVAAERAVRESQQMLEIVMNSLPESIFWKDKNLVYMGCNINFARDAGFDSPEQVIGKTDHDMPWKDQVVLYQADDHHVIDTGESKIDYEEPQSTPDGGMIWLRTSKIPLYNDQGEAYAVLGAYADVTEMKQVQAEIQKRASELQTVAEVSTAASTILEPERLLSRVVELTKANFDLYHAHIYLINDAGESLVLAAGAGEAGQQMLAQGWQIAADSATSLVARAFRTREGVIANDVRAAPDFLPNPLLPDTRSELAVPLIVGEQVLGVLDVQSDRVDHFTQQDVTIQTTLAGQIATAIENARLFQETRQVDRLKSEFLANMSHELRTPLNSIIGYVQLLLMDLEGEIPEDSYEDMKSVETNSKHLLNLINDVLDLARIEAGRMELHMENIDVPNLLDIVKSNNAGLFIDSPLTFNIEAEPDLPQIYADQIRITQVLNNLISNAYKFTETGGVTMRAYSVDNEVCIAIEDTGIGIAEKDMDTVFERFRQVDGSFTRRAEGTGLGLSITRLLVEMHGGRVTVRSKLGEGSTFTVHLPLAA